MQEKLDSPRQTAAPAVVPVPPVQNPGHLPVPEAPPSLEDRVLRYLKQLDL